MHVLCGLRIPIQAELRERRRGREGHGSGKQLAPA
jgi:hypothetical protein